MSSMLKGKYAPVGLQPVAYFTNLLHYFCCALNNLFFARRKPNLKPIKYLKQNENLRLLA